MSPVLQENGYLLVENMTRMTVLGNVCCWDEGGEDGAGG